jgi:hypothetical protein
VGSADILARPAKGEFMRLGRLLEAGAQGIMYPRCADAAEAREVVRWSKFAPQGQRGFDSGNADVPYCMMPMDEYVRSANEQTFLVVQIEDPAALGRHQDVDPAEEARSSGKGQSNGDLPAGRSVPPLHLVAPSGNLDRDDSGLVQEKPVLAAGEGDEVLGRVVQVIDDPLGEPVRSEGRGIELPVEAAPVVQQNTNLNFAPRDPETFHRPSASRA